MLKSGMLGMLVVAWLSIGVPLTCAQTRKAAAARGTDSCVDVATLRQGKSVRGLVVSGEGSPNAPWLMAVEREGLRQDNAALYARASKQEAQKALQAYEELRKRLEQELAQPGVEGPYKNFLQSELQRILPLLAATQGQDSLKTRFLWLELTNKDCSNMRRAPADAQRVAVWAWSENLTDVTRRDRADLERELTQANIDVNLKVPDLSVELPPRPEPEEAWFARLAISRYTLAGGVDFQGANGVYARSGSGQAVGMAELGPIIQKMMGGSLEALIAELDPTAKAMTKQSNNNWFSSVTSPAESLGKREFRVTRLEQDPSGQAATVETALVAKLPRGWQIVWSSQQTRRAADVTPAEEEQISNDPQVKAALGLLSSTLGAAAEAEIKKAMRYGAATMAAQKASDSDFVRFRDRYTDRLDGPPMN